MLEHVEHHDRVEAAPFVDQFAEVGPADGHVRCRREPLLHRLDAPVGQLDRQHFTTGREPLRDRARPRSDLEDGSAEMRLAPVSDPLQVVGGAVLGDVDVRVVVNVDVGHTDGLRVNVPDRWPRPELGPDSKPAWRRHGRSMANRAGAAPHAESARIPTQ